VAIDLSWSPNTEPDIAGYSVYRRDLTAGETTATRLNGRGEFAPSVDVDVLPETPTSLMQRKTHVNASVFHDANVTPGHRYAYSVSAVDRTGNESARSPEVEETAPQ
jgi:hypothetical protein